MKKKQELIIILAALLMIVSGFSFTSVKLRDIKLLIDLDKAIVTVKPPGLSVNDHSEENSSDSGSNETDSGSDAPVSSSYLVNIRHTRITCSGETFYSADEIVDFLSVHCHEGDEVILMDDYAEAHIFRETLSGLETFCEDKGLKFSYR